MSLLIKFFNSAFDFVLVRLHMYLGKRIKI